jgi:hypothetical protein
MTIGIKTNLRVRAPVGPFTVAIRRMMQTCQPQ